MYSGDDIRSRYYQNLLHIVASAKDIWLFFCGYCLGKGQLAVAIVFLLIRITLGIIIRELVYKRQKFLIREEFRRDK